MALAIRQIFQSMFMATGIIFGLAKKIDYKTLSNYIIGINQHRDLNGILLETSKCLKDILDYRLFSFVIQEGERLNVWIDPRISRNSLEKIIEKDFSSLKNLNINYINANDYINYKTVAFNNSELESYTLSDDKYFAKLYILPDRKMFSYHNEIMNIIIKTLGIAFTNIMNIKYLENAAALDPLTNCYNRREFYRLIDHNISNAHRYNKNLSVIMIDIDHFKKINDTFGHDAGDLALKKVSNQILSEIRQDDYLCRYGGEEFVVALPDTNMTKAMELAERVRSIIENLEIKINDDKTLRVTASFGVSSLKTESDKESLLKEADQMLYKAKSNGRNNVMPCLKLCQVNN